MLSNLRSEENGLHRWLSLDNRLPSLSWKHPILSSGSKWEFAMVCHCVDLPPLSTTPSLFPSRHPTASSPRKRSPDGASVTSSSQLPVVEGGWENCWVHEQLQISVPTPLLGEDTLLHIHNESGPRAIRSSSAVAKYAIASSLLLAMMSMSSK